MMKQLFTLLLLFPLLTLNAQNTVGLLTNEIEQVYPGYNLLYPSNQPNVYLLDNCGQVVHTWEGESGFVPGNSAYLLENGNLVKCKRATTSAVNDRIWAGGGGETVELVTWENELLASFTLNNERARLHHDIAPMPNGNILMIAWELRNSTESIQAGRDPALLAQDEIWSEMILEWDPIGDSIVWEWHAWDHLVQQFVDDGIQIENFGLVASHPELININYDEHDGHPDWLHINAIDYNPVLDQIVVSVPYFNEFWLIDHSTTTEEASGHTGGNSGKGGDLLYRWGNPAAYNRGTIADKKCFFQHDVHWVQPRATANDPNFGVIALFNNRVGVDFATINSIKTSYDEMTQSYRQDNQVFQPTNFQTTFVYPEVSDIRAFSNSLSSAQYLPNGNVLAISGRYGFAYELNPAQEVVWNYIVPFRAGASVMQGDSLERNNNITFKIERYPLSYIGFRGKDLTPSGFLELEPNTDFCGMIVSTDEVESAQTIRVFPNPTQDYLTVTINEGEQQLAAIYSIEGVLVKEFLIEGSTTVDLQDFSTGIYFLQVGGRLSQKIFIITGS